MLEGALLGLAEKKGSKRNQKGTKREPKGEPKGNQKGTKREPKEEWERDSKGFQGSFMFGNLPETSLLFFCDENSQNARRWISDSGLILHSLAIVLCF